MIKLAIRNDEEFREFSSEAPVLTIGRSPDNTIVLKDKKVSRRHARLEESGATYTITDLGSGNGTRVNGQAVAGARALARGDEIRLGVTTITVLHVGPAPAAAPVPPPPPTPLPPAPATAPPLTLAAAPPPPVPAPAPPQTAVPPPPQPLPPAPAPPPPPPAPGPAPTPAAPPGPPPPSFPANAPPAAEARPVAPLPTASTRPRPQPSWMPPRRSPLKAALVALASLIALALLVWGALLTARRHKRILPEKGIETETEEPESLLPASGAAEIALTQFRAKVAAGPVNQELIDEAAELSRRYADSFPRSRYPSGTPFDRIHEELLIYLDVERLAESPLRERRYESALKALSPLKGLTDPGVRGRAEALLAKVDGEIAKDFAEVEEEGRKLEEARRFREAIHHYQTHAPRFQGTLYYKRLMNKPAVLEALEKAEAVRPPAPPPPESPPKE